MDYNTLLELAVDLGYGLAMCGAETFRVEESITRVLATYGISCEVFAITNCLTVSIETDSGKPMTRMRRIGFHGNNLNGVERYNALSRRICSEKPDPSTARQWLQETDAKKVEYSFTMRLVAGFIGASGYAIFFGGGWLDFLCAGFCGILVALISHVLEQWKVNPFFSTMAAAFVMAFAAYSLGATGIGTAPDKVIIGTLMILLPGLIFTNALRDIIYGDTNSGVNRIVQVFLVAAAVALGTGAAWRICADLWNIPVNMEANNQPYWIQCLAATFGCIGFCLIFNIHGKGTVFCALGGGLSWAVYCITFHFSHNEFISYFCATIFATLYAESMARIRKYPAISYLLISIFPMIPGAGIYYTSSYITQGQMRLAADKGGQAIATAGAIAVGILMVSSLVRAFTLHKSKRL